MSVIIFIIILAVLILVHEYGHFIVAKKSGIRVEEFGLGYPPRAKKLFRKNGTDFTLNWLPFGGFVKIFGESPEDESINGIHKSEALISKPRWVQALVMFAGPFMNFFFAWLIIFVTLLAGLPTTIDKSFDRRFISEESSVITDVAPGSPAEIAGLHAGDLVTSISIGGESEDIKNSDELHELVLANPGESVTVGYSRAEVLGSVEIMPEAKDGTMLLGVGIDEFGIYKPNFIRAFIDSFRFTGSMIVNIAGALWHLITGAFTGTADVSNLAGPIGIVGLVGDASRMGIIYLLSFTALISINLGIVNLIPFPALDGGRLLFLLIEKIHGGRVNYKLQNAINFVGFALLIILMLFISYHDIVRLIK